MAIKRPKGSSKPKQIEGKDPIAVAAVIDDKKKSTSADKKTPHQKSKTTKATPPKKVKSGAVAKKKRATAKPKMPTTEAQWLTYIDKMSVGAMLQFLDSKGGKLSVTAQSVIKKKLADMTRLITDLPTDYNGWLEYFKGMTPDETGKFLEKNVLTLGNEAVAAGKRWVKIGDNPALIDRIVTSRLQQEKTAQLGNILIAAQSGDRIKTFEALRDNLAYKLEDGSGARDMTVLIKQLNEAMVTLDELYRESGQKDDGNSSIRKLLIKSRKMASRPRARQATMTIAEAEAEDEDDE